MRKAIIFDLDGTLLNTLEDLYLSANAALKSFGMPERTMEEVRRFVGNGVRNLMIRCVPDGEKNPCFEECLSAFKVHYGEHLNDHTGPYPGILKILGELSLKGFSMAIVSNKLDSAVKELSRDYFKGLIPVAIGEAEEKGIRKKPAPDTVYTAMEELGVRKEDCVYVGDSEVDLETAANAGIPCVLVSWGFRERAILTGMGAECIVDTAEELLKALTSLV